MRKTRRLRIALTAIVAAVALTGCTPQQPHDVTLPDLVWDNGIEPSSPLEQHPDVIFAREISLALAYAYNTGDFSFSFFADNFPPDDAQAAYERYLDQSSPENVMRFPGPYPFQPLSVEPFTFDIVQNDEPATYSLLKFCGPGTNRWVERQIDVDNTGDFHPDKALTAFMIIGHRSDDTRFLKRASYTGGTLNHDGGQPCDGTQVPVGRFDPQFPYPKTPVTEAPSPPLNYTRGDLYR